MTLPQTMSGVVLTGHGGPEQLQWRDDLATPMPGAGDVVIRVAAAAVNNTDLNTRLGWYSKKDNAAEDAAWGGTALQFPRVQGADICGHVVAVGEGVDPGAHRNPGSGRALLARSQWRVPGIAVVHRFRMRRRLCPIHPGRQPPRPYHR